MHTCSFKTRKQGDQESSRLEKGRMSTLSGQEKVATFWQFTLTPSVPDWVPLSGGVSVCLVEEHCIWFGSRQGAREHQLRKQHLEHFARDLIDQCGIVVIALSLSLSYWESWGSILAMGQGPSHISQSVYHGRWNLYLAIYLTFSLLKRSFLVS